MIDRERITRTFDEYVSAYDAEDPKIRLKIEHTYAVAALCEKIAVSAGAPDPELAWLSGMLHDIGRFEQIRRYHTFIDSISVDHAAFGADLLFREGLLERFAPDLSASDAALLECAIRAHSAYRLPSDLNETEVMYCNILRDADKLDIFRVDCVTPMEDIFNVTREELRSSAVSEEVRACFRERHAVLRGLKKTAVDFCVSHLCLLFELVYPVSRKIAREQGFVDKLLSFSSDNPETRAWYAYMRDHIWECE